MRALLRRLEVGLRPQGVGMFGAKHPLSNLQRLAVEGGGFARLALRTINLPSIFSKARSSTVRNFKSRSGSLSGDACPNRSFCKKSFTALLTAASVRAFSSARVARS
jgi:hypothetical protein